MNEQWQCKTCCNYHYYFWEVCQYCGALNPIRVKPKPAPEPETIIFYEGSKPVIEIDVSGWTIKEVVALMRIQRINDRTGKYYRL